MEAAISALIERFERGEYTRSQLIGSLSLLLTTSTQTSEPVAPSGIRGASIDHVSVEVSDMARSIEFYADTFNFRVVGEDKDHNIVRLGVSRALVSLHPAKDLPGIVDHFCIKVHDFDQGRFTQELADKGHRPAFDIWSGFYVLDPDGVQVQLI